MQSPPSLRFRPCRLPLLLAGLAALALFASCGRLTSRAPSLPETPSITGGLGWVLVTESYASLRAAPGVESAERGHLRDGAVLKVLGREYGSAKAGRPRQLWYLVEDGTLRSWVPSSEVEVFESREQAQRLRDAGGKP